MIWIKDQLQAVSSQLERCTTEEDFVLDLLLLCATFAENDPEIAFDFVEKALYDCLLSILNACQVSPAEDGVLSEQSNFLTVRRGH